MVDCLAYERPWEWIDAVTRGKVPTPEGKWVLDAARNTRVGAFAFEGLTSMGNTLMQDLARKAAKGINIGGQAPPIKFREGEVDVAGNSPAHFGNVQGQLTMACQESFHLPGEVDVIWTALAKRGSDNDNQATVLGPQLPGKALTSEVPQWFVYTFRVMSVPADALTGRKGRHILLVEDHTDITLPGAKGLGNSRTPLDAEAMKPIEPASLVGALEQIRSASRGAEEKIRGRLEGLALPADAHVGGTQVRRD